MTRQAIENWHNKCKPAVPHFELLAVNMQRMDLGHVLKRIYFPSWTGCISFVNTHGINVKRYKIEYRNANKYSIINELVVSKTLSQACIFR